MSRDVSSSKVLFHTLFASSYLSSLELDPVIAATYSVWPPTIFICTQLDSDALCPCHIPLMHFPRASLLLHLQNGWLPVSVGLYGVV